MTDDNEIGRLIDKLIKGKKTEEIPGEGGLVE